MPYASPYPFPVRPVEDSTVQLECPLRKVARFSPYVVRGFLKCLLLHLPTQSYVVSI